MAREMEKRIEDVCSRILMSSRNELYIHLRFFDVALSAFTYVMGEQNGELGLTARVSIMIPDIWEAFTVRDAGR